MNKFAHPKENSWRRDKIHRSEKDIKDLIKISNIHHHESLTTLTRTEFLEHFTVQQLPECNSSNPQCFL
jgi:hypothetical protein